MNFKTKALFLFGILLFGIVLSYFINETFMEGFKLSAPTPSAPTPPVATPSVTTPSAPTPSVATPSSPTPSAPTPLVATPSVASSSVAKPAVFSPAVLSPADASQTADSPGQKTYDNYNHYSDMTSTKYYGSTGTPINPLKENTNDASHTFPKQNSGSNTSVSNDYGTQYYSTLPSGIPASQIMTGDEHLYILKSEIVPPVCPACPAFPSASFVNNNDTPPPCPPCGRCPEPSFECKKVPNYNAVNNDTMPVPVLNDFSSFGM